MICGRFHAIFVALDDKTCFPYLILTISSLFVKTNHSPKVFAIVFRVFLAAALYVLRFAEPEIALVFSYQTSKIGDHQSEELQLKRCCYSVHLH